MDNAFYDAVMRLTDRNEFFTGMFNGLMMRGIDKRTVSVYLIEKIGAAASGMIYIMKTIIAVPLMCGGIFYVLADSAAEMYINDLKPFTDTKYGLFPFDK